MAYYHDLITDKSWKLLRELKQHHQFVLIGGWAVFLYTQQLKSKDIDIVVDYDELQRLRDHHELTKNDRLKKYEIHVDGIDVDIYVPFFSELAIPAEDLLKLSVMNQGFRLPVKEALLILKQKAMMDRSHSLKGEKDRIDIIALIDSGIRWKMYRDFVERFGLTDYPQTIKKMMHAIIEIPELSLNTHRFAQLKKTVLRQLP